MVCPFAIGKAFGLAAATRRQGLLLPFAVTPQGVSYALAVSLQTGNKANTGRLPPVLRARPRVACHDHHIARSY
jgi:hypothetical protein